MIRHTKKPAPHRVAVVPVVSFILPRHDANPVSNSPAMMSNIQFIVAKVFDLAFLG